jgi:hypothetical protein
MACGRPHWAPSARGRLVEELMLVVEHAAGSKCWSLGEELSSPCRTGGVCRGSGPVSGYTPRIDIHVQFGSGKGDHRCRSGGPWVAAPGSGSVSRAECCSRGQRRTSGAALRPTKRGEPKSSCRLSSVHRPGFSSDDVSAVLGFALTYCDASSSKLACFARRT